LSFGSKLKAARVSAGMKQSQLAQILSVENTTVSNWENGTSKPHVETFYRLCNMLSVSPNWMLDWNDCESNNEITDREYSLIQKYRRLDDRGKSAVDNTLDYEYQETPVATSDHIDVDSGNFQEDTPIHMELTAFEEKNAEKLKNKHKI